MNILISIVSFFHNNILSLLAFIFALGVTIFIHELGHFIFSKKAGIYIYEFSLGMGPKLFSFKRKNDETTYSIRAIPIGGFVSLAGEQIEEDKKVPANRKFGAKKWSQRFLSVAAGVLFNFIFAIIILFFLALANGSTSLKPIIGYVAEDYPAYEAGIESGDKVLSINGDKIKSWDQILMFFEVKANASELKIEVEKPSGKKITYSVTPKEVEEGDTVKYKVGIGSSSEVEKGIIPSLKYAFSKFGAIVTNIWETLRYLVTGTIKLNKVSGPIGIYTIIDEQLNIGISNYIYIIAFLSVNVGFINFLPIPAFDGGRLLFLIIEKIKRSPVKEKTENIIHTVGYLLLLLLMIVITISDIFKLTVH